MSMYSLGMADNRTQSQKQEDADRDWFYRASYAISYDELEQFEKDEVSKRFARLHRLLKAKDKFNKLAENEMKRIELERGW